MPLVSPGMRLSETKHLARTSPSIVPVPVPDGHTLVKADHPTSQKDDGHVLVPFANHLTNLLESISVRGIWLIGECQCTSDCLETRETREIREVVGVGILVGWMPVVFAAEAPADGRHLDGIIYI